MDMVTMIIVAVGILQLPMLVDIVDNMFPQWRIGRLTQAGLSHVLFGLVVTLYLVAIGVFFSIFLPLAVPEPWTSTSGRLHIAFAAWLWIVTVWHYIQACTRSPGTLKGPAAADTGSTVSPPATGSAADASLPPTSSSSSSSPSDCTIVEDAAAAAAADPKGTLKTKCRHCAAVRSTRTHHCNVCGVCVIDMDHHCPFTRNCVGRDNFLHFFMFLLCTLSGLFYAGSLTFGIFSTCWLAPERPADPCNALGLQSLMFIPVLGLIVPVGFLLGAHVLLLLADLSTVDYLVQFRTKGIILQSVLQGIQQGNAWRPGSKPRTLLFRKDQRWWHFVLPISMPPVAKVD
jgi:hypothetical protein